MANPPPVFYLLHLAPPPPPPPPPPAVPTFHSPYLNKLRDDLVNGAPNTLLIKGLAWNDRAPTANTAPPAHLVEEPYSASS